jgi:isoleucyl-tRNA synthetase
MNCKTALARAEVEHEDERTTTVYVARSSRDTDFPDALWPAGDLTTTSWTLPANHVMLSTPR